MKNYSMKIFALLFAVCIATASHAQSQATKENTERKIQWLEPGREYYSENYSVPYLRFEGVVYGENFIPQYSEKIKVNPSTNEIRHRTRSAMVRPALRFCEPDPCGDGPAQSKRRYQLVSNLPQQQPGPGAIPGFWHHRRQLEKPSTSEV